MHSESRLGLAAILFMAMFWLAGCASLQSPQRPPVVVMSPPPPPPPPSVELPRPPPPPAPAPPPSRMGSGNPTPACLQTSLPQFPWPEVPEPTDQRVLPRSLFPSVPASLGGVVEMLRKMAKDAGYPLPPNVVGAGCNGFALILDGERIRPDGGRIGFQQMGQTSNVEVGEILRRLFTAAPGKYRLIVFVVSNKRPELQARTLSADQLSRLAAVGASELPAAMAGIPFDTAYEVHALVYEFVKRSKGAEQVTYLKGLNLSTHLQQAGLLQAR